MNRYQNHDEELIQLFINGKSECMNTLISRYQSKVFTAINLVVNDRYIAEDIFQETFIRVISTLKSGKYEEAGKFLPWVIRIARNLAMDYFRKTKRMPTISTSENEDVFKNMQFTQPSVLEKNIDEQNKKSIRELIKMLPDDQREVLILRQYGDLSFKEIADITNCSINTALGRMRYALINLKKLIEEKATHLQR